jgi:protein gp37
MNPVVQWPRAKYWDHAWNPIIGCKPASPACENCYAKALAKRFHIGNPDFYPHWMGNVVGCESGPNRRPCKIEWVEHIVDQCRRNHVPVFVKQLGIGGKCVTDISRFPSHLRIRQVPWSLET